MLVIHWNHKTNIYNPFLPWKSG